MLWTTHIINFGVSVTGFILPLYLSLSFSVRVSANSMSNAMIFNAQAKQAVFLPVYIYIIIQFL